MKFYLKFVINLSKFGIRSLHKCVAKLSNNVYPFSTIFPITQPEPRSAPTESLALQPTKMIASHNKRYLCHI
jgi:hypothetical protein